MWVDVDKEFKGLSTKHFQTWFKVKTYTPSEPQMVQMLSMEIKINMLKSAGADKAVGYGMVSLATVIFSYYTVWVVILPFVDRHHFLHGYFMPRIYAILIPVVAGVIVLALLGISITVITMKSKKPKEKSS